MSFQSQLTRGALELGLTLSDSQTERLLGYHELLVKWNKAYNLTSVRGPKEMIDRHLLDSLSLLSALDETPLIDVGTGPGLPGMIIALIKPELTVYLLDSNGKKTRFLNQVKMTLGVSNATIVHHRLESWRSDIAFGQITSRAFATLADMACGSRHLLAQNGRFLAMKGVYPVDELAQLPEGIELQKVTKLAVPSTDGERHLVELVQKEKT